MYKLRLINSWKNGKYDCQMIFVVKFTVNGDLIVSLFLIKGHPLKGKCIKPPTSAKNTYETVKKIMNAKNYSKVFHILVF